MNVYTMSRQDLEDTVVILQRVCHNAAIQINEAALELDYGSQLKAMTILQQVTYRLMDGSGRPLEGSRIDSNTTTHSEVV
jgi:hypothetical protein